IVAEALAGCVLQTSGPRPLGTSAPRVEMLAADADGKIRVTINPAATQGPANMAYARFGNAVVFDEMESFSPALPVPSTGNDKKLLTDVNFEAYTMDGRIVPRTEALNRLKAGGLVLVGGNNRQPDPASR